MFACFYISRRFLHARVSESKWRQQVINPSRVNGALYTLHPITLACIQSSLSTILKSIFRSLLPELLFDKLCICYFMHSFGYSIGVMRYSKENFSYTVPRQLTYNGDEVTEQSSRQHANSRAIEFVIKLVRYLFSYLSVLHRWQALPYKTGIWAQKYPALARIDQGHPGAPEGNICISFNTLKIM